MPEKKNGDTFSSYEEAKKYPKRVRVLTLKNKKYTAFPDIFEFSNLEVLDISFNEISIIPREISRLTKLRRLDVGENNLTKLPPEISKLENLTHLMALFNQIDSVPNVLCSLKKLELLNLNGNPNTKLAKCLKNKTGTVVWYDQKME